MTRDMVYVVLAALVSCRARRRGRSSPVPHTAADSSPGAAQPMDPSHTYAHDADVPPDDGHAGSMGGMMGMMPAMSSDPKQQVEIRCGEMMKAMGDIMMKYAERMRPAK